MLTGKGTNAIAIGNGIILVLGIVNRYLQRFRGAPFQISDLKALKTAGNVFLNYDYTPDLYMIVTIVDMLLWYLLIKDIYQDGIPQKRQKADFIVMAASMGLCIPLLNGTYQKIYNATGQFSKDTYLSELLLEALGKTEQYPDGYNIEHVQQILKNSTELLTKENIDNESAPQTPNIVVIMNEAFADLRVLGEFETDYPVMEYWDSLEQNCSKGWANVSVYGGTTANSEYEFLTSDATALYQNAVIPYNNFFDGNEEYESLVEILKYQGYETTAFHPYLSSGWNRPQVYRAMQFDNIIFSEDLEEPLETLRLYTSDRGDYKYIRQYFEKKKEVFHNFFLMLPCRIIVDIFMREKILKQRFIY